MKTIVFGAGAVGGVYAAKLSRQHDVTVIARRPHVEAIQRGGLRITGCEEFVAKVQATTTIEEIAPDTLVLLTTKVHDNREAASALAGHVQPDTIVLCVQNGLRSEQIVREVIGDRCLVLRGITQLGAIFAAPGLIDLRVEGYTLIERHERSEHVADILTKSGLDGRVSDNMDVEVWRKLIYNCVINPVTSILGSNVGAIAEPSLDPLKQLIIDECVAVAQGDGVCLNFDFQQELRDKFGQSHNIVSMRQDLLNGKRTEIDYMNGEVVALGERLGIPCPVNASLFAIIKAMEVKALKTK